MKKLVPVLVIAMVLALAFTVAASAADVEEISMKENGLYDINFNLGEDKDEAMYGMVVIEAAEGADFVLTQDNIRYIDQATASSTLSFTDVGPMDLENDANKYYVYIGGGDYKAAQLIATLSTTASTPDPGPTTPDAPGGDDKVEVDGDVDANGALTVDDAVYLVNHIAYGDFGLYPVTYTKSLDFDSSGALTVDDAVYLVNHIAYGDFGLYPLYPNN